jgi:hypothetical protein
LTSAPLYNIMHNSIGSELSSRQLVAFTNQENSY